MIDLEKEIARLRKKVSDQQKVIRFYADENKYNARQGLEIFKDSGDRARSWLNKEK